MNPETFEALRKVLEAKKLICALSIKGPPERYEHSLSCGGGCAGSGYTPNAAFAPLLALFQERCPRCLKNEAYTNFSWHEVPRGGDTRCSGGYVSRFDRWAAEPDGAFAGAAFVAVARKADSFPYSVVSPGAYFWDDLASALSDALGEDDPDSTAMQAIIKAVS